jgi:hypothetical protein
MGVQLVAEAADATRSVLGPPADWTGTDAPTDGAVLIPDHVDPTNPRRVYELEDRAECKYLYEIVLTDGTAADINRLIADTVLADLWDRLYLPHDVRVAWAPTIRSRRPSATTGSTPTRHPRHDQQPTTPEHATPGHRPPAARTESEPLQQRRPDDESPGAVYGSSCCGS